MKKKKCKACGETSGKKNFCEKCKTDFPFKSSGKSGKPFSRIEEYRKSLVKKK